MTRDDAIRLLESGQPGVQRWNRWRQRGLEPPSLNHAVFNNEDLSDVDLTRCQLTGAQFVGATLFHAQFQDATLDNAAFRRAHAEAADFRGARLPGTSFRGAVLCGCDFRRTNLARTHLEGAEADAATRWPEGFVPLEHAVRVWPD